MDLMAFLRNLRTSLPVRSVTQQFEIVQPLRSWLLWLPVSLLDYGARDTGEMVVLAHLYAVGLLVERLFPALGASCFGSMSVGPIEQFTRGLTEMHPTQMNPSFPNPRSLLEVPLEMVAHHRASLGLYSPVVLDHNHHTHPHHGLGRLTLDTESAELVDRTGARSVSYSSDGARSNTSPMMNEMGPSGVPHHPPQSYFGSPLSQMDHYNAGSFPGMGWMGTPTSCVDTEADHRLKLHGMEYNQELASPALWPSQ